MRIMINVYIILAVLICVQAKENTVIINGQILEQQNTQRLRLKQIDSQIQSLQMLLLQSPINHLISSNELIKSKKKHQNGNHFIINNSLQNKILRNLPKITINNLKNYLDEELKIRKQCQIELLNNNVQHLDIKYYKPEFEMNQFFSIVINKQENSIRIYDKSCILLIILKDLTIKHIFQQKSHNPIYDKSHLNNIMHVITSENQLGVIDFNEIKSFSMKNHHTNTIDQLSISIKTNQRVYKVLNNKLLQQNFYDRIIGILAKVNFNNNKQSKQNKQTSSSNNNYKQKQLFIIYESSLIKVFDEQGNHKITMKQHNLFDDDVGGGKLKYHQVKQIVDHHPYPILVEKNWVYLIDTNKYSKHLWSCPYIPNIITVKSESFHSSEIYVLTTQFLYFINIKNTKDISKKNCEILKQIPLFLSNLDQNSTINLQVYKNVLFLNQIAYNISANEFLKISDTKSSVKFIQTNSKNKKNSEKQIFMVYQNQSDIKNKNTKLQFYNLVYEKQQTSFLVWIGMGFLLIIFLAFKFFKSSSNSYEKQLLFPYNHQDMNNLNHDYYRKQNDNIKQYIQKVQKAQQQDQKKGKVQTSMKINKNEKSKIN